MFSFFKLFLCFSYSFDGVYSTFLQVLTATLCLFIISFVTLNQVTKVFLRFFTPQKIYHHNRSTYYIDGFLRLCIYTLQHIPEVGSFYFACRQSRSLTQPSLSNTCFMEHLDHENLSLCLLSTFLTYHGRTCLLLLSVLLTVFQIAVTQPYTETDKASGEPISGGS